MCHALSKHTKLLLFFFHQKGIDKLKIQENLEFPE